MLGQGVDKDIVQGARWMLKSALQENAPAQYNLARMYQWGKGVEKNQEEAMKWYRRAAAQGHEKAMLALARLEKNETIEERDSTFMPDEGWPE